MSHVWSADLLEWSKLLVQRKWIDFHCELEMEARAAPFLNWWAQVLILVTDKKINIIIRRTKWLTAKKKRTSYQERHLSHDNCKYIYFSLYRVSASKKLNVFYLYLSPVSEMCAKFSNSVVAGLYIKCNEILLFPLNREQLEQSAWVWV